MSGQVREVATYDSGRASTADGPVLLEWKHYGDSTNEDAQEARTQSLASILQRLTIAEGLRIPQCVGYTADHRNYRTYLVFQHPTGGDEKLETLYRLLGSKGVLPLGDRFKLALNLATSLSAIHTAGWLHKQLSSYNILFFPHGTGDRLDVWRLPPPFVHSSLASSIPAQTRGRLKANLWPVV